LLRGPRPLLQSRAGAGPKPTPDRNIDCDFDHEITLTDDGSRVLEGRADRVALCGIDRWLGGVHLTGHGPVWRYDATSKALRVA
jgi:hypothetical protein